MGNINLILLICVLPPLLLMMLIYKGSSRTILISLLIGCFMGYYSAEVSGFIKNSFQISFIPMTSTGTPLIEETLKIIPVIVFAFFFKPKSRLLLEYSFTIGVGFAIMENLNFMASGLFNGVPLYMLLFRCIMGGAIHGGNTLMVGFGVSFIHSKRKLFFTGTFALFSLAVVLHSISNMVANSGQQLAVIGVWLIETLYFAGLIFYINKSITSV